MRNNLHIQLILGAGLISLAACQRAEMGATAAKSAVQAQSTPTLSTTDATFLNMAGMSGMEEVTFAQLAQTNAGSPAVKRFAAQMITDHTPANQQVTSLAQAKQITPATTMDNTHTQLYQQLKAMHGRAFDQAYTSGQVQDHQMAVDTFKTESQNGTDADVRGFAAQSLPMMQHHLQMAKAISKRP